MCHNKRDLDAGSLEVMNLKEYVKAVLYVYPLLKTVETDYAEHIKIRALLSYRSPKTTEEQLEYLANEIIEKRRLQTLKHIVEHVLDKLCDEERALVWARYFTKKEKIRLQDGADSMSTYFRKQSRLYTKLCAMFGVAGLTEEKFDREYAPMALLRLAAKKAKRAYAE